MPYDIVTLQDMRVLGSTSTVKDGCASGLEEVIQSLRTVISSRTDFTHADSSGNDLRYYRIEHSASDKLHEHKVTIGVPYPDAEVSPGPAFTSDFTIPAGTYAFFQGIQSEKNAIDRLWSEVSSDRELSLRRSYRVDFHAYDAADPTAFDLYLSLDQ